MRFNQPSQNTNKVINYEGEGAYKLSKELELYSSAITTVLDNTYYEKGDKRLDRIKELVTECDDTFVGKLAVYCREQMYLRSVPIVLAVELAKKHSGDKLVQQVTSRVVARADEITELLAYYQLSNNRTGVKRLNKLSKQLQHGLKIAFNKFGAYNFRKYNRNNVITLRDAYFLVHPTAKDDDQYKVFDMIAKDTLPAIDTWETKKSQAGQSGKSSKDTWEEMIDSRKLGYMANLRNLRNMIQDDISDKHINKVCNYISNEKAVLNSKQFPFRFLSAYDSIKSETSFSVKPLLQALEQAAVISASNIEGFDENTKAVIAIDLSGSMDNMLSDKSSLRLKDVGLVLGSFLQNRCEKVINYIFGEGLATITLEKENILGNVQELRSLDDKVGHATNGYLVIKHMLDEKLFVDKVFMFTDCQLWNTEAMISSGTGWGWNRDPSRTVQKYWNQYKSNINLDAKMYIFDLSGYGNVPLNILDKDVYFISGWSEKLFKVLDNPKGAIAEVMEINLGEDILSKSNKGFKFTKE